MVAALLQERGGKAVMQVLHRLDAIFSSCLLEAELRSVFRRESLDPQLVEPALAAIRWVMPDRPLRGEIQKTLQSGYLRGADLWHVACALYLARQPEELPFLTLDKDQKAVAARLGFPTSIPGPTH